MVLFPLKRGAITAAAAAFVLSTLLFGDCQSALRADDAPAVELDSPPADAEAAVRQHQSGNAAIGSVRRVEQGAKVVWINLGSADRMRPRMRIRVFAAKHEGDEEQQPRVKGIIVVTRVSDKHLSEARIVEQDDDDLIVVGDQLDYLPPKPEKFSLIGGIDLDGDGKSDREQFHQIIKTAGAEIDNEADEYGNRTGHGINTSTKFLVIGNIPEPPANDDPVAQERRQQVLKRLAEMRAEAKLHGVRMITLDDVIGWKRRKRTPSTPKKWFQKDVGEHPTPLFGTKRASTAGDK